METKKIYLSKTFWTGIATICTGIGLFVTGDQNIEELIISSMGVVFTILRLYTEKPISK